jgi:hypothetical protein
METQFKFSAALAGLISTRKWKRRVVCMNLNPIGYQHKCEKKVKNSKWVFSL